MLDLGEFCRECLCSRCGHREECGTMEGNTDSYCHEECKGDVSCMNNCSQFYPDGAGNIESECDKDANPAN